VTEPAGLLTRLVDRGVIAQTTDPGALADLLDRPPVSFYTGFDPTAPSLHVGNLVQILLGLRLQRAGHRPVVLIGGATGLIGDPKATGERSLNSPEVVAQWSAALTAQVSRYYDRSGPNAAIMVNNLEWTAPLTAISLLRDIGKHISVNRMLDRDAVAARLAGPGISFTEFSYQLLQSLDFLELHRRFDCALQTGGSDQWGNIVMGVELGRRVAELDLHGLTTPLITTASGQKMGKTAAGAIWLSAERLAPYDYFQFWRNTEDADVGRFLRLFTELPLDEIDRLAALQGAEINEAKKILAGEATKMLHGDEAAMRAADTARQVFEQGMAGGDLPVIARPRADFADGIALVRVIVEAGLAKSNGEARRLAEQGGIRVNDQVETDPNRRIGANDLDSGGTLKLSAGRKRHALLRAI